MLYKLFLNKVLLKRKKKTHLGKKEKLLTFLITDRDWPCMCLPKSPVPKPALCCPLALSSGFLKTLSLSPPLLIESMTPFLLAHYHIFINYNPPITFARLLESRQSILGAEKPGGIVLGFVSRTKYRKQSKNVLSGLLSVLYPCSIFSTGKKIMIGFLDIRDCLY